MGERFGRFEIVEPLGEGSYAETFKGRDPATGEVVVLKVPNPNLLADPSVYARFMREATIARTLDHPHVQRGFELGGEGSDVFLVLEYVDGRTLRERLGTGPVEVALAVEWGRQLAEALAYLEAHGIAHRDLKPENILVTQDDQLKLADFGTALLEGAKRLTWKHLTDSVGTPSYMSPEQIQGGRGDARSDIYAWGAVLYEMLTGAPPFGGDTWMAVMAGHLARTPAPLFALNPAVSRQLDAVVRTALRRQPANRYQHATDLLEDLGRLDELDVSTFDLTPEPPVGGLSGTDPVRHTGLVVLVVVLGLAAMLVLAVVIGSITG